MSTAPMDGSNAGPGRSRDGHTHPRSDRRTRGRRLQSWRKAKASWVYTIKDVRRLYGVSRNTPLNWIKQGLRPIDHQKPIAFRGDELNRFHRQRWEDARRPPPGPGELYCVGCNRPKQPQGDQVEFVVSRSGAGRMTGICPDCGGSAFLFVTRRTAAAFFKRYQVNSRPDHAH